MADINPLRYRGYYYDTKTGFYYLQSRYYDPVTHRFINADSYASTDYTDAIACNMFAYCGNNPISFVDETGSTYTPWQIHNFVVEEICSHHPTITGEQTYMIYAETFRNHTYGFCDLYDISTHEIWEVKRFGSSYSCSKPYATRQLENYVNNGSFKHQEQKSGYVKGGTFTDIETFTFYKPDLTSGGFYQITYWDAGDGIINYDYHLIRPQKVEVKESVVAAEAIVMCLLLLLSVPALAVA